MTKQTKPAQKKQETSKKSRTRTVLLERWEDGDVVIKKHEAGLMLGLFSDASDISQLGLYIPRRGQSHFVRITCEIIDK